MIGLDRLLEKPGVVAAGQFDDAGNVIRFAGEIPKDVAEHSAKLCGIVTERLDELFQALADKSKMEWMPMTGWAVWGGKYALCVVNNTGVFVETTRADFNQIMVDLFGKELTGGKPQLSGL